MFRSLSMLLGFVLMLAMPGRGQAKDAGAAFTPAQRAEIVAIMRDALRHDPSLLRDAIAALQEQDAAQQKADTRQAIAAHHAALVANPADPAFGDPHADVTVVEFFDPRCPYCHAMLPVMTELLQKEPHVRLVYKDIPVLGPQSVVESRALLAAQQQNGYLRLLDALMRPGAPRLTDEAGVLAAARSAGLDAQRLKTDMAAPALSARLQANLTLADTLGIHGTPALIVGDQMFSGATDLPTLRQAIAAARRG